MTRSVQIGCIAFLLTIISFNASAQSISDSPDRSYFPGQLYVKFVDTPGKIMSPIQKLKTASQTRDILKRAQIQQMSQILTSELQKAARQYLRKHPRSSLRKKLSSLNRIYQLHYSGDISPVLLAAKLKRRPDIKYAEPRYFHYLKQTPEDPLQGKHLDFHRFYEGWNITTGSEEVIIGIIDSGVDYTHEDLKNEIWINQDEIPDNWQDSLDSNNDGQIISREVQDFVKDRIKDHTDDGIIDLQDALSPDSPLTTSGDTDGNGYKDDLWGWDFWQSGLPGQNREQDNDPIGDFSTHGTHVSGLAGASTDNRKGVSGAGYNARLMPVKAGGINDIPETNPNETNIIGFGYPGMLYAAMNGADIINTSWGGSAFSDFEKDILNTVTDMGVLVVSAAGNSGSNKLIFPAAFDQTLAVGSIETNGKISSYSNFGYNLDVLATGTDIIGPIIDQPDLDRPYARLRGTSMSSPIAAGLAALVKSKHPDWSGQRIKQQIRATSHRVDTTANAERKYQLGHGYIDAKKALSTSLPGIQVISSDFVNNKGQKLNIDEPGRIHLQAVNHGKTVTDLTLQLVSQRDNITLSNPRKQGLTIAHNDTVNITFSIKIEPDYNLENRPSFILSMNGQQGAYSDFSRIVYKNLLFGVVTTKRLLTSFASNGTIGFTNALEGTGGVGFQPRRRPNDEFVSGPNLLFEGGLIASFDGVIKDAVRSVNGKLSRDFKPLGTFRISKPGPISDLDGNSEFMVKGQSPRISKVHFDLQTFAFNDPGVNQAVYVKYKITNRSYKNRQLQNIYVGLFNDWDIGSVVKNATGFIEEDSLLYAYDKAGQVPYYTGVVPLNEASGILAINNAAKPGLDPLDFGIHDGYTDNEKYLSLTSDTGQTTISETDISTVVASGPYNIGPRASITVGFIYAYGTSLKDLQSQINAARQRTVFQTSSPGTHLQTNDKPQTTRIFQNYPNPFNSTTNIRVDLAKKQRVTAKVYNVVGQKVQTIANRTFPAGIHTLRFHGDGLSSGLYLVDIRTPTTHRTLKISLVK